MFVFKHQAKSVLLLTVCLILSLTLSGCGGIITPPITEKAPGPIEPSSSYVVPTESQLTPSDTPFDATTGYPSPSDFDGVNAWVVINDNIPTFTETDITTEAFESYSDLDDLGRCGVAYANICTELMPTDDRESISSVTPSGWQSVKYDIVDGKYLYNRCHLIGFQLAGENANEKNLITGTRYLNINGMLPFENLIADYVHETDNHVLYRVEPIYTGDNLVADGVHMEAYSVEDRGDGVYFNVFCFNIQPGIEINYTTGESHLAEDVSISNNTTTGTYVLNTNSYKFHLPSCSYAEQISDANRQDYTGSRQDLIDQGYQPCGVCNP